MEEDSRKTIVHTITLVIFVLPLILLVLYFTDNHDNGFFQSLAASLVFAIASLVAIKVSIKVYPYIQRSVRIFFCNRVKLIQKESDIFHKLILELKAKPIHDSKELRKALVMSRKACEKSIHMLPLNIQSIRFYSTGEGKEWLDSEYAKAKQSASNNNNSRFKVKAYT